MNTIKIRWEAFEMICLQEHSEQQRETIKIAFYAGITSLLNLQTTLAGLELPTDAKVAIVAGWKRELDTFNAEQIAKVAVLNAKHH